MLPNGKPSNNQQKEFLKMRVNPNYSFKSIELYLYCKVLLDEQAFVIPNLSRIFYRKITYEPYRFRRSPFHP